MIRILLVGGGTGGHIFPLVAISQELQKIAQERGLNLELAAMADSNDWRAEFENLGIKFKRILSPKIKKVEGGSLNFLALLAIPFTFIQALWLLFVFMPDLVFSKGSYASVIPSLAATLYFIPVFTHESDAIPGKANRFISGFAKRVFISFETTARYFKNKNIIFSGNPIRKDLLNGDKNSAASYFNLISDKKTILFFGGSQGAKKINDLVLQSLVPLAQNYQIIHQVGPKNVNIVGEEVEKIKKEGIATYGKNIEENYRLFGFLDAEGMKSAYVLADVIISRAGANLIFEMAALSKPCILIPITYSANDHQKMNAQEFAKFGAVILEEENLKPHILINQINFLLKPENYSSISQNIGQFAKLDASEIIAQEIINYVFRQ